MPCFSTYITAPPLTYIAQSKKYPASNIKLKVNFDINQLYVIWFNVRNNCNYNDIKKSEKHFVHIILT